jgi:phospholipid/cholesterol/gamma-HCH transport system substrate-binding protein
MRYVALVALVLVLAAAVVVLATSDDDGGDYKVRAIFDNAGFVIPGEDVKVAGVKIGTIDSIDVTDDFKAAVVLDITDAGYQDFRKDAECIVRPQSLIGERFVECELTQARSAGEEPPPKLEQIEDGPGEGEYLLPVENTAKAVDLDLINNIMQRPVRERLSIILSDLGIGVAGRGEDLSEVIRRGDPALKEIDEVLKILAEQNTVLSNLARDSDTILAPLARERRHVSGAIANASEVAQATAERRGDLEADIERLPRFLRELRPTMVRLGALSDQMTPVLIDLGAVAPDVNRTIQQLGPFSRAATPALESLGDAAETGIPAVRAALPVTKDLRRLASAARPVGSNLRKVLDIFYQVAAINGFDAFGHYLRAGLIVNQCANYAIEPTFGCSANYPRAGASSARVASRGSRDEVLQRTAVALARSLGLPIPETAEPAKKTRQKRPAKRRDAAPKPAPAATPEPPAAPAPPAEQAPPPEETPSRTETLLDYLFGGDG